MNLFTLIVALMPLLSFALAFPAKLEVPDNKQELTVVYHRVNSIITAEALSDGALVGRACSATLNSGSFTDLPIIFDVDERGSGNLTVGPSIYSIHEDIEYSGGIICGRMYDHVEAAVSCTITVPAELPLPPLSGPHVTECISNDSYHLAKTLIAATSTLSGPNSMNETGIIPIHPRQGTTNCGTQPSCSVGFHKKDGVSVSYTSEAKVIEWTSGGFHVQKDWRTGTDYSCAANPGETVCVWYKFAHTAYRVQNVWENTCGWSKKSNPFILFSPNQDNVNGGQYCVIGPCRHEGEWWWDYSGPNGDDEGNQGC